MPRLDPQSLPQHVDRLYRAAWGLCGSRHDAEDLVQETFARVLARPRTLSGQDELAYLMRVLRNTFLTQRRDASRRPQTAYTTLDDINPPDPRSRDRPEQALQAQEVFATIAELPENYRLALVAVDVVGLSYREAATALGTREATIATRVFRARERVARDLQAAPMSAGPKEAPASPGAKEAPASPGAKEAPASPGAKEASASAGPREAPASPGPREAPAPEGVSLVKRQALHE